MDLAGALQEGGVAEVRRRMAALDERQRTYVMLQASLHFAHRSDLFETFERMGLFIIMNDGVFINVAARLLAARQHASLRVFLPTLTPSRKQYLACSSSLLDQIADTPRSLELYLDLVRAGADVRMSLLRERCDALTREQLLLIFKASKRDPFGSLLLSRCRGEWMRWVVSERPRNFGDLLKYARTVEQIDELVHLGADPNFRSVAGSTALHHFALFAVDESAGVEMRVAERLLACGADALARDHAGNTPLHRLLIRSFSDEVREKFEAWVWLLARKMRVERRFDVANAQHFKAGHYALGASVGILTSLGFETFAPKEVDRAHALHEPRKAASWLMFALSGALRRDGDHAVKSTIAILLSELIIITS